MGNDYILNNGKGQTVTAGKVKVHARVNSDGSLSICKAEGSSDGILKISYILNGKMKKTSKGTKVKPLVYKTKIKIN